MAQTPKTIRFAAIARFGDEIRAFHVYGPTPTRSAHDEVLAVFPNTAKGNRDAQEFTGTYPVLRGEWA